MAIFNQYDGQKTIMTVRLDSDFTRMGKHVLLVNVDSQGLLANGLGYQRPDQIDKPCPPYWGILSWTTNL